MFGSRIVARALLLLGTVSVAHISAKTIMADSFIRTYHASSFAEALSKCENKKVVLKFFAPWCPPCRASGPAFERISEQMGDQVVFIEANLDNSRQLAGIYGIRSIPALVFIKDGRVVGTRIGAFGDAELRNAINQYLLTEK